MRARTSYLFILFALLSFRSLAQEASADSLFSAEDKYKDDLNFMVQSFQTMVNLLGDSTESQQDKDQIISQSYLKYFDSDKVQIEDDLDPNRQLPMNKNVQSYLQDIVFFYKNITFEFEVSEINKGLNDQNQIYYKVSMEERLEGVNLYGQPLKEINPRFIELNLNEKAQEFKIVSVYTSKLSEKEDMATWWNELDFAWRKYFSENIQLNDSINYSTLIDQYPSLAINDTIVDSKGDSLYFNSPALYASIKKIFESKKIKISPSDSIKTLSPLSKLVDLTALDFSGCSILEVSPLRSILSLTELNASASLINNVNDLQYLSGLKKVNLDNTAISDLSMAIAWSGLESLSIANTMIKDLTFLSSLGSLEHLNLSGLKDRDYAPIKDLDQLISLNLSATSFNNIAALNSMTNLHVINLDGTPVKDLKGINDSLSIEIISFDNTTVSGLSPLVGLQHLKMIYCDNSGVLLDEVKDFIAMKPGVLVIYETQSLQNWWSGLDQNLKDFIHTRIDSITEPPDTEILHQIIFTEKADLSGQKNISSLDGFQQLINLKVLNISGTMVSDLSPISSMTQLAELNISNTKVKDISSLSSLHSLKKLNIQGTAVNDLDSLVVNHNLQLIMADSSGIDQSAALKFNKSNTALVIYQSAYLNQWWSSLSEDWISIFSKKLNFSKTPSVQELQELVNSDSLLLSDFNAATLKPLSEFKLLKYLKLDHVTFSDLSPLLDLPELNSLAINNGEIADVATLAKLTQLSVLDLSNTSLSEIDFISGLTNLKNVNLSSTLVDNIKPLSDLNGLVSLDLSNTRIKKINYLNTMTSLKEVKLTNTDLSDKRIDSFKRIRPDVKVIFY